jgi:hypothetical protein
MSARAESRLMKSWITSTAKACKRFTETGGGDLRTSTSGTGFAEGVGSKSVCP